MALLNKKVIIVTFAVITLLGILFAYKAGRTITVIGSGGENFWKETAALFPPLPQPEENRIDILLVGIRGYDGTEAWGKGEWLADTIILASFNKLNNQAAVVSIPRDLYVEIPEHEKDKINAVYAIGETNHYGGGGLQLTKAVVSRITGVYIDYAISIDFRGFKKVVDNLGGITIYRATPFAESKQWIQDGRDGKRYWRLMESTANTTTTSDLETESSSNSSTTSRASIARGWEFYVPAGANLMNSEEALYYSRSRYSSSDFDRMRRQQEVVDAIKSKALSLGVLANPVRVFNILDAIENNVRTDMSIDDMKDLLKLAQKAKIQNFKKAVLDTNEKGLLVEDRLNGLYVLLPKGGNYEEIQSLIQNIVE